MKVALVHDWLTRFGDTEQVLRALCGIWPEAPVYTAVFQPAGWHPATVRTSFLQGWPGVRQHPERLWPLLPLAFEELDLRGFDLVISSHHTAAQGVIVDAEALHLAYVHPPGDAGLHAQPQAAWRRALRAPLLNYFRAWEAAAGLRVDHHLVPSAAGAARVAKTWRRRASILPPPICLPDLPGPGTQPREPYVLLVAAGLLGDEQTSWQNALEGCGATVKVWPGAAASQRGEALARAAAVCVPRLEYAVTLGLEALACGTPLLLARTGTCDVAPFAPEVAVFFDPEEPGGLQRALETLQAQPFDPARLRAWAENFAEPVFQARFKSCAETLLQQFRAGVSSTDFTLPQGAGWNSSPFQEPACFNPLS